MNVRRLQSFAVAAIVAAAAVATAFGRGVPARIVPHPIVTPIGVPIFHTPPPLPLPPFHTPIPRPTLTPLPPAFGGGPSTLPGALVPLSMLPPLPARTMANTATPGRRQIQAATGASIIVTESGNANCNNSAGDVFAVGCTVRWRSGGLSGGDTFQDYYIAPNVADGTVATAVGTNYGAPQGGSHTLTTTVAGIYVFAVYDVTQGKWAAVVYINVSATYDLKVYQDAFHTQEIYQFAAGSSTAAYVYATNLTPSDYYVVYIESTSVNPVCVFSAPIQSSYAVNGLCQPNLSNGEQAPGGNLSVTWNISPTQAAGTYSVVLYDKTQNERLAQVQISVTGPSGQTMLLTPDGTNANPSPRPLPVPTAATAFAWDGPTDQSTSGLTESVLLAPSSTYTWTITDPTGQTLWNANLTGGGNLSHTFQFQTGSLMNPQTGGATSALAPGSYVPRSFTAQLYDTVAKSVYASQVFQILGYYVSTTYTGGGITLTIPTAGGSATTNLTFTNSSPVEFGGVGNSDSFSKIAFSTGVDFGTNVSKTKGYGETVVLSGYTLAQCEAGCSATVSDSNGNSWKVNDLCANTGGSGSPQDECAIEIDPTSPGERFAPNATITLPSVVVTDQAGSVCSTNGTCQMLTSVLPTHGLTWSSTSAFTAYAPAYISIGSSGATASVALAGVYSPSYISGAPQDVEAHFFDPHTTNAQYERNSPYSVNTNRFNIIGFKIKNNSPSTIYELALGGGYWQGTNNLEIYQVDQAGFNVDNWQPDNGCANAVQTVPSSYVCFFDQSIYFGGGILPGTTQTFYLDVNPGPGGDPYSDWALLSAGGSFFVITPTGTTTVPILNGLANASVDSLAYAQFSLNSALMSAYFSPATVGTGSTSTESVVFQNTALGADANPDYVDTVVVAASNSLSTSGNPSVVSPAGWSYIGSQVSGSQIYWIFSACNNVNQAYAVPPPVGSALTSPDTRPQPQCNAGGITNALGPGQSLTMKFTLQNLNATGNVPFTIFAHGADGNGWSAGKTFQLLVNSISAGDGFTGAGGYPTATAVATNTEPTIGGNSSATYGNAYTYTVTNNSGVSSNITSFRIRIPGTDVNGVNATDSNGNFWHVTGAVPTLSGNVDGCAVTNALAAMSATSAGADGEIDIGGGSCALKPGDTMTISFTAIGPQSTSDSYQFQSYCINNTAGSCTLTSGTVGGANWLADDEVQVQLSIGLSVVVDPTNPGPGGSTPNVSCALCSFSGSTVTLGNYSNNTTTNFGDIVRASVIIQSSTAITWNLSVQASSNPANSTGSPTNELLTQTDSTNSSQGAGISFDVPSFTVVPTVTTLQIANGTSITSRTEPYDVLQNFQLALGAESLSAQSSVITYTLVAN
uniref:Uncharacterized protein n=1 Tax=mine drainage metagenome TaxID=410659 RepID=E6Q477_9ZZZZ